MLLLPPIQWSQRLGELPVRLPCPGEDWIGLIADCKHSITSILRSNPSVFLFACEAYCVEMGKCVSQHKHPWRTLQRWSHERLANQLVASYFAADFAPTVGSIVNPHRTAKTVKRWLKANGEVDLVQYLVQFVAATSGLCEQVVRSDSPEWLPARLKMDAVPKRSASGNRYRQQLANRWTQPARAQPIEQVQQLLRLKQQSLETEQQFAARLHQEKLESMKQLAYGASHEINNPLANIASRAQALVPTENDLNRKQKLATIYEQAMRAHEMISDMMLFANPPQLQVRQTDLRLLIPSVIKDVEMSLTRQKSFRGKRIDFSVTLGPKLPTVNVDPGQLAVLMHCLVKNSMESIESDGSIELDVRCLDRSQLLISVTDDGGGVSDLAKRHLFDPFYSGREAGRGLGFGLSKAWRIAQLHGAILTLDESQTPGARFVVTLPLGAESILGHNKSVPESTVRLADPESNAA